ncbi:MAG: hypothetical protein ACKOX6_15880 [Bdellovibrio sp.]
MRSLRPEMIKFFDDKLKNNGLAQHAIDTKDARLLFTEAAKVCVGIREKTGNNDGPMVELIQKTVDGVASRESWCMAFVQTCLAYAELKTGLTSPIFCSEHCMTTFRKTSKNQRVKYNPLPGAIVIWQHYDLDEKTGTITPTDQGHTGIVLGADELIFTAVEGNTTSGSNGANGPVVREGGGVYYTTRNRIKNGTMIVEGFLKPF